MRILGVLAVVALLAGCGASGKTAPNAASSTVPSASPGTGATAGGATRTDGSDTTGTGPRPITWIITSHAIDLLRGGLTGDQLHLLFDSRHAYVLGPMPAGFTSARHTESSPTVLANPAPGADALMYDNESWPLTPHEQQLDPAKFEAQMHQVAQAHHLTFISTPATDLVNVLDPNDPAKVPERYLKLGIIADAARNADIVDIQAQGLEGSARFTDFVTKAAAQARAANPKVLVLAGISTNPSGRKIDPQTLAADANSVRNVVDGFWLNVPQAGEACPKCGVAQPQVAYPWLKSLLQ